ncbi:hypothetical protein TNIN_141541 [Trichonephila inaurata madagascariensis]|uniref:Uncharacterized protein n=1 Tax=Trichonephila inaurata madagascariensis TaxID=2747483 RepID=A0A8X6YBH5_9ARAC|nr:hypothetical protein TNIN_141541 [Trichonephila inaurata madagascariensis]
MSSYRRKFLFRQQHKPISFCGDVKENERFHFVRVIIIQEGCLVVTEFTKAFFFSLPPNGQFEAPRSKHHLQVHQSQSKNILNNICPIQ